MSADSIRPRQSFRIRSASTSDLAALHAINEASTPGVGSVTSEAFSGLFDIADLFLVADAEDGDGTPAGFMLCLIEGTTYQSPNYLWISERYPQFAYCDRIAIAPAQRGSGLGRLLYAAALQAYAGRRETLLCEVNLAPPNPGSLRFHASLGFSEIGQSWLPDRSKGVVYLARTV